MTDDKLMELITKSGAVISPSQSIDEIKKILSCQEEEHRTLISKHEDVLKRLARWFRRDADKVEKVDPEAFYIKILWGIHDNMDKFSK